MDTNEGETMKDEKKLELILENFLRDLGLYYSKYKEPDYYIIRSRTDPFGYFVNKPKSKYELGIYMTNIINNFRKYDELVDLFKERYKIR